jgi:hypothetical protein
VHLNLVRVRAREVLLTARVNTRRPGRLT